MVMPDPLYRIFDEDEDFEDDFEGLSQLFDYSPNDDDGVFHNCLHPHPGEEENMEDLEHGNRNEELSHRNQDWGQDLDVPLQDRRQPAPDEDVEDAVTFDDVNHQQTGLNSIDTNLHQPRVTCNLPGIEPILGDGEGPVSANSGESAPASPSGINLDDDENFYQDFLKAIQYALSHFEAEDQRLEDQSRMEFGSNVESDAGITTGEENLRDERGRKRSYEEQEQNGDVSNPEDVRHMKRHCGDDSGRGVDGNSVTMSSCQTSNLPLSLLENEETLGERLLGEEGDLTHG